MCGIVGLVKFHYDVTSHEVLSMKNMLEEINYRGPDGEFYHINGREAFGFCRLAINDITHGDQPFANHDESIIVMVNGEIYNHHDLKSKLKRKRAFRSRSDCEIALYLYEDYGINFLNFLNGMFAITILDKVQQKLYLIKDRFGIKPLFYNFTGERIIFASEIKALLQYPDCPRTFNWMEALSDSWLAGHVSNNITPVGSFFSGIENIPGGNYIEVNLRNKTVNTKEYWNITKIPIHHLSKNKIIEKYINLLDSSSRKCLMSDVDIGLFLSGGIDSVSIGHFAAKHIEINSFSVVSRSTIVNGDAEYALKAAQHYHFNEHFADFNEDTMDYSIDDWKSLLWLCESPYCSAEQLYKYHLHKFAKHSNPNIKVILTGQGSDEFNGGYSQLFSERDPAWPTFMQSLKILDKNKEMNLLNDPINTWDNLFQGNLLRNNFFKTKNNPYLNYVYSKYRDIQMYNCWLEDRIAAGNHIENRVPFLDHNLIELTLGVEENKYADLFFDKNILREGLLKYTDIPESLAKRPKVPFFYGKGVKSTRHLILNIIKKNNYEIIDYAFNKNNFVNIDSIYQFAKTIENHHDLENIEFLTRLINMGMLEQMSSDLSVKVKDTNQISIPPRINTHKLNLNQDAALTINTLHIPILKENIDVLMPLQEDNLLYITINNNIEYLVDSRDDYEWFTFLSKINGIKSIKDILSQNNQNFRDIKERLEESVLLDIIELKPLFEDQSSSSKA
ncbi:asparagine synthase (glutamine-hydrolyzing) [Bacillus altitudinis]|uniref:asparagine synthase (glutamine-hydrolyzing) n=1 Tax=Bacillus altitudinis TaxID=293387 RepID=UPI0020C3ABE8|nr:asparagine synthase (glutamine-hydrolyzing) [Bacillus altitudinis]MCY7530277.1 asparagine synthase (glutamine-hydrolyzing) [Bacillus altitudinis]